MRAQESHGTNRRQAGWRPRPTLENELAQPDARERQDHQAESHVGPVKRVLAWAGFDPGHDQANRDDGKDQQRAESMADPGHAAVRDPCLVHDILPRRPREGSGLKPPWASGHS